MVNLLLIQHLSSILINLIDLEYAVIKKTAVHKDRIISTFPLFLCVRSQTAFHSVSFCT